MLLGRHANVAEVVVAFSTLQSRQVHSSPAEHCVVERWGRICQHASTTRGGDARGVTVRSSQAVLGLVKMALIYI